MTHLPYATSHRGIDLIAVGRYLTNTPPLAELTEDEQKYAAEQLTAAGLGSREIAKRLGINARTIVRWRADYPGADS